MLSSPNITSEHYFQQPVSNTFHGRDVFASVAGYLSKGKEPAKVGEENKELVRFAEPKTKAVSPNLVKGIVIKVDKFGNLITNITPHDAPQLFSEHPGAFKILIGKSEITKLNSAYAQGTPGEVFGILGSLGFLEVATNRGSAQQTVGADKGSEVSIVLEGAANATA